MTKKEMFIKYGIRIFLFVLIVASCSLVTIQGSGMLWKAPERFAGLGYGALSVPAVINCTLNFRILWCRESIMRLGLLKTLFPANPIIALLTIQRSAGGV